MPKILDLTKHTTIRKIRKRGNPKLGDVLSLRRWTGKPYRSKQEVIKNVVCTDVNPIFITKQNTIVWHGSSFNHPGQVIGDNRNIAIEDGFASCSDMLDWFEKTHGLPFMGNLIRWEEKP